jgi:RNA polymerase sigma-54 factor
MKPSLEIKPTLRQVLSPQLRFSLKLLQMPKLELRQEIIAALEENPLLEEMEWTPPDVPVAPGGGGEEEGLRWDKIPGKEQTLYHHLLSQIEITPGTTEEERIAARKLLLYLDPMGHLIMDPELIAIELEMPIGQLRKGIKLLHRLDPIGCGAKDCKEAVLIQARLRYPDDRLLESIIRDHWEELCQGHWGKVEKIYNLSEDERVGILKRLRTLDPFPGIRWGEAAQSFVQVEAFIYKVGDEYQVHLDESGIPRIRINPTYIEMLESPNTPEDVKEFLKERYQRAMTLVQSIEQRKRTIRRVVETIIEKQRPFLEGRSQGVIPMTLKEVAEKVGLHQSTVSRVVSRKYVQTPQGTFPLKLFFSSSIDGKGGKISSMSIKQKIRRLISQENPAKPLGDQAIANILAKEGIHLARRTVTKYREAMGIPASTKRRLRR